MNLQHDSWNDSLLKIHRALDRRSTPTQDRNWRHLAIDLTGVGAEPVLSWAEQRLEDRKIAARREFFRRVAVLAAAPLAGALGGVAWYSKRFDFATDFSSRTEGSVWRAFESGALFLERFTGRTSAVPTGTHLLVPSQRFADGNLLLVATVDRRPAEFVLRGESPDNCYLLQLRRIAPSGSALPLLSTTVVKRRKGVQTPIWPAGENSRGPVTFPQTMATVEVEMDNGKFSVWLRRPLARVMLGVPAFEGKDRRLLAYWTDPTFRQGMAGIRGPLERSPYAPENFRVFLVGLKA